MKDEARGGKGEVESLVCFALKEEAAPFRRFAGGRRQVDVLVTGIGKRNAERALREYLASHKPARVLSCGFAGGLSSQLAPGMVVFAAAGQPELEAELAKAGAQRARFHCAERVAATAEEKRALRQSTGADAVEMESHALGALCAESHIPFAIVRVILDAVDEDLPLDFNRLMTPEQGISYSRLAAALAKSPGKIGGLLKLRKQGRAAAEALARVLVKLVDGG
jgi:adenosylhomocysteine nucleosidase